MGEKRNLTGYSHRRAAMRLAERAAELTAVDSISTVDVELLQIELDELVAWVDPVVDDRGVRLADRLC
jgi:hypothetical protein